MKSVLLTFLIFFVVFTLLKMNIVGLLSSSVFHIVSYTLAGIVFACAIYFVGLPSRTKEIKQQEREQNNDEK